jgi:hypothetical protein
MTTRTERAALAQAGVAALLAQIPEPRAELADVGRARIGPQLPTTADLDAATAATAAAMADPAVSQAEVDHLIEMEAATYDACPDAVVAEYEAEAEAEI